MLLFWIVYRVIQMVDKRESHKEAALVLQGMLLSVRIIIMIVNWTQTKWIETKFKNLLMESREIQHHDRAKSLSLQKMRKFVHESTV